MNALAHGSLVALPDAYVWLIPELLTLEWPEETRATCSSCVMLPGPGEDPEEARFFNPEVRCCSYHPSLPNHRLGRILNDAGPGADLVRRRLARRDGVGPHSIDPSRKLGMRYEWGSSRAFGHDADFRCPYWVGGDLACGVWQYREAVCRTWFCRHVDGVRGTELWRALRRALMWVDDRLSIWLVRRGTRPGEEATDDAWVDWYRWCDDTLSVATREEVEALADDTCRRLRRELAAAHEALAAPYPTVVEPAISKIEPTGDGVRLYGGAAFDPLEVPTSIFSFLAELDGHREWSEALERAGEEAANEVTVDLIQALLLRGALQAPQRQSETGEEE